MGHPDVDVWNHVWGYWFFLDSIFRALCLGEPSC